tara:strand:+ start:322 stop:558 length:237 start_codon:yes stop_codon:yes gene_type:complete
MVSLLVDFVLIMVVTVMVVTLMVVTLMVVTIMVVTIMVVTIMLLGISSMFRLMTVIMMAIVFFFPADDFADNLAGCSC